MAQAATTVAGITTGTHSAPEKCVATHVCEWCGVSFNPIKEKQRYCSDSCRFAAWDKAHPRQHKMQKRRTNLQNRSLHLYFSLLAKALNDAGAYLPEVRIRGKARNSDHHHFSEKGVPSLFIYSMGGPGYYHDVFDTAESLPLSRFNEVTRLLLDFTATR